MPGRGDSAVYLFGNVKLSGVVRFLYTEPDIAIGLQIANDIQGLFRVSGVDAGDEGTVFQIQVPLALEDEAAFAYYAAGPPYGTGFLNLTLMSPVTAKVSGSDTFIARPSVSSSKAVMTPPWTRSG